VAWPTTAVVVDLQGQPPHDGGAGLHGNRDGSDGNDYIQERNNRIGKCV
jgi:hypothetical protein